MLNRQTVTLHHIITVYNDIFDPIDGVMGALAKKKTPCKEDVFIAVKLACQKLSYYHSEVTPSTGMLLISAHILELYRKLRLFRNCDKGRDINPMIAPVRTDPVCGRARSRPVPPERQTGPSPRLAVWDWTVLVWTRPNGIIFINFKVDRKLKQ